jgi:hypothetical protein
MRAVAGKQPWYGGRLGVGVGRRARWLAETSFELGNQFGEVLGHARQQLE